MFTGLWKKCFDTRPLWYTHRALETVLWNRARTDIAGRVAPPGAAGCSLPSLQNRVSVIAYLLAAGTVLGAAWGAGPGFARAEIVAYVDQQGRRVFVNTEDDELRRTAERGGATAALRLIERRKRALPGIDRHLQQQARTHGVDPELVDAVIRVESAWNPQARSHKGALGLMQVMPATGARFGVRDLFDPRQNITAGVRYLRWLLDRFDNNLEWSLAAYNAGENAVARSNGVPPYPETRQYLERLRTLYPKLRSGFLNGPTSIYRVLDDDGRVVFINE